MNKKIVIASILKPVNDVRMYEKFAISLSRLPNVEIFIAGFKASNGEPTKAPAIQFFPLFAFQRLDWKRFLAPWKFYKFLLQVKPAVIIVSTHELLIVSSIYKILFGAEILYDVQENYYRNIAYTQSFPPVIRNLVASYVRMKEWLTRPLINHYFLAEKNYEQEFSFSKGKSTVIENKAKRPTHYNPKSTLPASGLKLLYSGTISKEYGIWEAIQLAQNLHKIDKSISLTIIGYSSISQLFKEIKSKVKDLDFITLIGGDQLVPHAEIINAIQTHDVGLLPYLPNKSTMNCIPTKLYEYMAYGLPMLVNYNPIWDEIIQKYQAGISIDYSKVKPEEVLAKIKKQQFYTPDFSEAAIFWENEEIKLLNTVEKYLKK